MVATMITTMNEMAVRRHFFGLFAALLDYPDESLPRIARECEILLAARHERHEEAGSLLGAFRALVETAPLGQMQELYTGTFDLDATCHPYVGYHLFGESYQRSALLLGLKERYRARDFTTGNELPDHLAVMLRFLAVCQDTSLTIELCRDAILPALRRMMGEHEPSDNSEASASQLSRSNGHRARLELRTGPAAEVRPHPYDGVLQALRLLLEQDVLWLTCQVNEGGDDDA